MMDYDSVYITFAKIDGEIIEKSPIKADPASIEIPPGTRVITVNLAGRDPDAIATGQVKFTAHAGKTYQFVGEKVVRTFRVTVFEVDGQQPPKIVHKSIPIRGKADHLIKRLN